MNIAAVCLRAGGILGTALLLTACVEPVLEGPNYPAEDPPWIASGYQKPVGDIEIARRLILIGDAGLYLEDDPTLCIEVPLLGEPGEPPEAGTNLDLTP